MPNDLFRKTRRGGCCAQDIELMDKDMLLYFNKVSLLGPESYSFFS